MSDAETSLSATEPLELLGQCLDEQIYVKLRGNREMVGRLHAYDSHCNMVLDGATETIFEVEDGTEEIKSHTRKSAMVFIRGDTVILIHDGHSS